MAGNRACEAMPPYPKCGGAKYRRGHKSEQCFAEAEPPLVGGVAVSDCYTPFPYFLYNFIFGVKPKIWHIMDIKSISLFIAVKAISTSGICNLWLFEYREIFAL